MNWVDAPDVKKKLKKIISVLELGHVAFDFIVCYRSFGSKGRAIARIWSLPRVWQQALKIPAHYIIEVISERFDKMNNEDQERTLIHELMHIPKTFSGALVSHKGRHHRINNKSVEILYRKFINLK